MLVAMLSCIQSGEYEDLLAFCQNDQQTCLLQMEDSECKKNVQYKLRKYSSIDTVHMATISLHFLFSFQYTPFIIKYGVDKTWDMFCVCGVSCFL